tara:strand:- start:68 stop:1162 length:1095 start_codon:yes stop_codon:yes gene_type:complete
MAITRIGNPAIANIREPNFRNIVINGDMSLAQRGTSTASITGGGYYSCDRWRFDINSQGTWTQSQSTDVPTGQGFAKSTKLDCTTADASPAAGDLLTFVQKVEGQNLQYLKKGTSSAESTTLSFWVKSNKTGTYIAELVDSDNSRQISKSYTISSANTWEKKTITYAGDTTGAFANDNARSLDIVLWLGAGSNYTSGTLSTSWSSITNANEAVGQVNLADSTSNEWYITGIQLEAGSVASDFEFLPFDVNLARCQRYFYMVGDEDEQGLGTAFYRSNTNVRFIIEPPVTMRSTPSLDQSTASNSFRVLSSAGGDDLLDDWSIMTSSTDRFIIVVNATDASGTGGQAGYAIINLADTHFALTAEL